MRALLADLPHIGRIHSAHAEHGCGVAKARRLHGGEGVDELLRHLGQLELEVVFLGRDERLRLCLLSNGFAETPAELRHILRFDREACCLRVPAKADEQVTAGRHRIVDVDARNRARGADAYVAVLRKQNRRPLVLFHQPGRRQTDDAGIPALAADDDGALRHEVDLLLNLPVCLTEDGQLKLPALGVVLIELLRDFPRGFELAGRQQLHAARGQGQPPARVDPRRHAEGHVGGGYVLRFHPRGLHQRDETRALRLRHGAQAVGDDHAVFTHQRHDVRNGRQRRQLPQRLDGLLAAQRLHQLERDACAAQPPERILAQQRIEHGFAFRQLRSELVVVRHDHAHAQLTGVRNLVRTGDAAVHRDQQLRVLGQPVDGRHVEAIALAVPVRNIEARLCPLLAQVSQQDGCRRHAVHVVIAEDDDLISARDALPDDRHCPVHVLHAHGIVQQRLVRMQVLLDALRGVNPTLDEQLQQPSGHRQRGKLRRNLHWLLLRGEESEHDGLLSSAA